MEKIISQSGDITPNKCLRTETKGLKKCKICEYEGAGIVSHHIIYIADFGHPYAKENLINLCSNCHNYVHHPDTTYKKFKNTDWLIKNREKLEVFLTNPFIGLLIPSKDIDKIKDSCGNIVKCAFEFTESSKILEKYGLNINDAVEISLGNRESLRKLRL